MKEITYIIDKDSKKKLVIRIALADREGYYLKIDDKTRTFSLKSIEKGLTALDKLALNFLIKEEIKYQKKQSNQLIKEEDVSLQILNISAKESVQALKLMAATGKLYFNQKQLACDFYSKADFAYYVESEQPNQLKLLGKLKWGENEILIQDCDFLSEGPPHWFIKGIILKIIGTDVTWKELDAIRNRRDFTSKEIDALKDAYNEDNNEPKVHFSKQSHFAIEQQKTLMPILVLKDRTGAFADLYIQDGDKKYLYHDFARRNSDDEKALEQDLLETDFIVKPMVNSHYYCPLDNVAKSLNFILEIGWKIMDFKGRQVLKYDTFELEFTSETADIEVKGNLNYDTFKVDLRNVVGAFNRKDRFIEISEHHVGLFPDTFENKDFENLLEIAEVVTDKVTIKRHQFGSIEELLEEKFVKLDLPLKEMMQQLKSPIKQFPLFKGILRPYQEEGVNFLKFLYDFKFSGMLADDMGLGKTVQVLAFLSLIKTERPILIILPSSLVFNWHLEIKRFTPHFNVLIHHGIKRGQILNPNANIILTTYATLRMDLGIFRQLNFECLILDEAQTIKNAHTQIAKAVFALKSNFRLSMTGTPIENHLKELWSHFRFLMPNLLGKETDFLADLQAASSDSRYLQKIKSKIRAFVLRRKKEDVAKDLPEKIEQTVFVEMESDQRKIYDDYLKGIKGSLIKKIDIDGISKHRMEILEAILRLRQICCDPILVASQVETEVKISSAKLEALMEDIETAVSEGRKILVYSQFTGMLKLIAKAVKEKSFSYVYLDGSTTDREKVVTQFQEDPSIPLFLISLKAGGVGLNLTAADYVFLFDPWWNDSIENQAINRAHRIGRKDTVLAKRYIMAETIEEKMMTIKQNKEKMGSLLFEDALADLALSEDDFRFLLS